MPKRKSPSPGAGRTSPSAASGPSADVLAFGDAQRWGDVLALGGVAPGSKLIAALGTDLTNVRPPPLAPPCRAAASGRAPSCACWGSQAWLPQRARTLRQLRARP